MMNFFQKKEKETKTNQHHSITFRVDSDDKARLLEQANELNISLSEFVRNKALAPSENNNMQSLSDENAMLKKLIEGFETNEEPNSSEEFEEGTLTLIISEENKKLLKSILSFVHWNRYTRHPSYDGSDLNLAKAFLYCTIEFISETVLGELRGLRRTHNIHSIYDIYNIFAVYYMENE